MSRRQLYAFLRDLTDNNSKRWMDAHRDRYEAAKAIWTDTCASLLKRLAEEDDFYRDIEARDTVERINNNLMYHPDRPTYKGHFGFAPGDQKGTGLYVAISPSYSFIGGGVHNPDNGMLRDIRAAIDADGDALHAIVTDDTFTEYFEGGLEEDPKMLKSSPKGYASDHQHIDLLRRKNFTVSRRITQEDVIGDAFPDVVAEAYVKMQPLLTFMRRALG